MLPAPTLRPLWLFPSRLASTVLRWPVIADGLTPPGFARRSFLRGRCVGLDAVRGAEPLGCCRSVLSHKVAPLSFLSSVRAGRVQALFLRSGYPRLLRPLLQAIRKKPSVGVSLCPQAVFQPGFRGEMLSATFLSAASRRMETEACPRAVECKTMSYCTPFPITKAAVSSIRKRPEGTCRLVTLQTIRVRIVKRLFLKIQRLTP